MMTMIPRESGHKKPQQLRGKECRMVGNFKHAAEAFISSLLNKLNNLANQARQQFAPNPSCLRQFMESSRWSEHNFRRRISGDFVKR